MAGSVSVDAGGSKDPERGDSGATGKRSDIEDRLESVFAAPRVSPVAAYSLLSVTIATVSIAFWLALSEGAGRIVGSAWTVMIAGLAGGLVCVSSRETRATSEAAPAAMLYLWIRIAMTGAFTSLGVFSLALVAFPSTARLDVYYPGLGLFGAITGYLGASVVMAGARLWAPATDSPLDIVNRALDVQLKTVIDSLQPRITNHVEEVILGPPTPPYEGFVAISWPYAKPTLGYERLDIAVWFDTSPNTGDLRMPVSIRGNRRIVETGTLSSVAQTVPIDVLLHDPTSLESPLRKSLRVPVQGASDTVSFGIPYTAGKLSIAADTLLEIRCRGSLIRIVDLQRFAGN